MAKYAVGDRCICPNTPLQGRHFCAICNGPSGKLNSDDRSISYHNGCFGCSSVSDVAAVTHGNSTTSAPIVSNVATTQQSTLVTAKDVDPKAVIWANNTEGDRPSTKPGELGRMVKSVLTICGIDAMVFNMEQLCQTCSNLKLTGQRSKPRQIYFILLALAIGKLQDPFSKEYDPRAPTKTKNCVFQHIHVLFSDETSKFIG
jgi:hypothetical protein